RDRQHRHPARDDGAGADALEQGRITEQPDASAAAPDEPVQSKSAPRRRGIVRIVEREHRDDDQRNEQEYEESAYVSNVGDTTHQRARQRGNHERRITSPNFWP